MQDNVYSRMLGRRSDGFRIAGRATETTKKNEHICGVPYSKLAATLEKRVLMNYHFTNLFMFFAWVNKSSLQIGMLMFYNYF
jgi:hypothetical protein